MVKFGNICDIDAAAGRVRVEFQEDGITSAWLPVVVQGSKTNKYFHIYDIGENVICLMDPNMETGAVMGAIYDTTNTAGGSADLTKATFPNGTTVSYDRNTRVFEIVAGGTAIKLEPAGLDIYKGGESLKALLADTLAQIKLITHPAHGTPPANVAAFIAIEARLNLLFS